MQDWSVYIIRCRDGSLYTGITTDIERRFNEHCNVKVSDKEAKKGSQKKGAKFFRKSPPDSVVYREKNMTRSQASSREAEIKALTRAAKLKLISSQSN